MLLETPVCVCVIAPLISLYTMEVFILFLELYLYYTVQ